MRYYIIHQPFRIEPVISIAHAVEVLSATGNPLACYEVWKHTAKSEFLMAVVRCDAGIWSASKV